MGCKIHLFAEFGRGGAAFQALSDGAFPIPRDYELFAALAGVRGGPGFVPFQVPRGIPHDVSPAVAERYFVPVMDGDRASMWCAGEHVTPDEAETLVRSGRTHWRESETTEPWTQATHGYIANPDWHSATWLAAHEIKLALIHAGYQFQTAPEEFQLLVAYVELAATMKGSSTRVVLWFDN